MAQGSLTTLQGLSKTRVADFVHGADGFGNLSPAVLPTGVAASMTAASYLAKECARQPGQVGVSHESSNMRPLICACSDLQTQRQHCMNCTTPPKHRACIAWQSAATIMLTQLLACCVR